MSASGRPRLAWAGAVTVAFVVAALVMPAPAAARQKRDKQLLNLAVEEYKRGRDAFLKGKFEAAVEHYQRANAIKYSAKLHYNIGLAYERLGRTNDACSSYRRFVAEEPNAPQIADANKKIAAMCGAAPVAPPEPPPPPDRAARDEAARAAARDAAARDADASNAETRARRRTASRRTRRRSNDRSGSGSGSGNYAPPPPPRVIHRYGDIRRGFTLGASIGFGYSAFASVFDSSPGVYVAPRLGYFFTRSWGIVIEPLLSVQSVSYAGTFGGSDLTLAALIAGGMQFYPTSRIWVSGGLGLAYHKRPSPTSLPFGSGAFNSLGFGLAFAAGYEFGRLGRVAFSVEGRVAFQFYGSADVAGDLDEMTTLGVGLGVQFF